MAHRLNRASTVEDDKDNHTSAKSSPEHFLMRKRDLDSSDNDSVTRKPPPKRIRFNKKDPDTTKLAVLEAIEDIDFEAVFESLQKLQSSTLRLEHSVRNGGGSSMTRPINNFQIDGAIAPAENNVTIVNRRNGDMQERYDSPSYEPVSPSPSRVSPIPGRVSPIPGHVSPSLNLVSPSPNWFDYSIGVNNPERQAGMRQLEESEDEATIKPLVQYIAERRYGASHRPPPRFGAGRTLAEMRMDNEELEEHVNELMDKDAARVLSLDRFIEDTFGLVAAALPPVESATEDDTDAAFGQRIAAIQNGINDLRSTNSSKYDEIFRLIRKIERQDKEIEEKDVKIANLLQNIDAVEEENSRMLKERSDVRRLLRN